MIEVDGLTKKYGDKTAVDGISFAVEPGIVTGSLTATALALDPDTVYAACPNAWSSSAAPLTQRKPPARPNRK
jgi:hypothetical protein